MTLVVLIADGGPDAGLGHISRCSALAVALRRRGVEVRSLSLGSQAPLERYGICWQPFEDSDPADAEVIVLDSYRAGEELRRRLASSGPLVAFLDDRGNMPEAALVVRSGRASGTGCELAGPSYACLDPAYWSVPPRSVSAHVKRVLIATGGGDGSGAGARLADLLKVSLPDSQVTLVRGPYAPPIDPPEGVQVVCAPESLFDLLAGADLVACAAGQTMLEALAAATPCVALVTAENQRAQAEELRRAGALTVAYRPEQAASAAGRLASDTKARELQVAAGRRVVDGQGALRVAAAVLDLCARRRDVGANIELRRADLSDAGFLLELRNDPVTRRFSFTQHEISEGEHVAWLRERLSDPSTLIWVAVLEGRPSGQLRLTRLDERTAEVHIGIAPDARGRGLARETLTRARDLCARAWPEVACLRARIVPDNTASVRAFEAAGFREVEASAGAEKVFEREIGGTRTSS